jgi:hypothetical protein
VLIVSRDDAAADNRRLDANVVDMNAERFALYVRLFQSIKSGG